MVLSDSGKVGRSMPGRLGEHVGERIVVRWIHLFSTSPASYWSTIFATSARKRFNYEQLREQTVGVHGELRTSHSVGELLRHVRPSAMMVEWGVGPPYAHPEDEPTPDWRKHVYRERGLMNQARGGSRPISVTAFVDWNTQIRRTKSLGPLQGAIQALQRMAKAIARALKREVPTARFIVAFRLYHGWYKGWQPTENLDAIITAISQTDFHSLSTRNVAFLPEIRYGHTLLSALSKRIHRGIAIHLPNTLREQSRGSPVEKMVDTALGADLLAWARSDPGAWALVLSEDDDVIPSVFTAESWIERHGGRVLIARARTACGPFLKLNGLVMELRQ